jgi:cell division protein ZapA
MDTRGSDKSEKQPVRVTILSQSYTLLAKGDPREVVQLAESVDELMSSIAAKAPNADTTRVAVLACLHLADRLHELEQDLAALKERVGRKTEQFAALLEQAFDPGPKTQTEPGDPSAREDEAAAGDHSDTDQLDG